MTWPAARAATGRRRIQAAQAAMTSAGFDALLLIESANLRFLSGYPSAELTLARPFLLVVPRRGEPVFLVHRGREAEARRYAWLADVRTYEALSVAPVGELRPILDGLGLSGGRIGLELGREQRPGLPIAEIERLRAELAPATFEDAADLLWRLRMVKSAEDVEALRTACRLTAESFETTLAGVRAGDLDTTVVRRMETVMTDGGGARPWVLITAGAGNYALATGWPVGRAVETGDMVWMDAGCSVDGFWSDFSRAGVVGGPSAEQADGWRAIVELTERGIAMVRPGVPVADIAASMNEGVHALGLPVVSWTSDLAGRVGHGIGYDVTEPPHVSTNDPTILEVGMVISVEPGVATETGLFHCEANVLVTRDGHDLLSTAPPDLATLG